MEQLQNGLLTMLQTTLQQVPGVGGKSESGSGDEFQKLLERAQNPQDVEQPEPAKKPQAPEKKEPVKDENKKPSAQDKEDTQQTEDPEARFDRLVKEGIIVPVGQFIEGGPVQEMRVAEVDMETETLVWKTIEVEGRFELEHGGVWGQMEPEGMQPQRTLAQAMQSETADGEPELIQTAPQTVSQTETVLQEEAPMEDMVESVRVETGAPQEESGEDTTGDEDLSAGAQPLFRNVEAAPIKVGDVHEAEAPRQPDSVGDQVMGALNQALSQGETKVELQLTPENLGKMVIELHFDKSGSLESILMSAERRGTMDLLTKNLPDMMRAFGQRYGEEVRVEIQQPQESQQEQQHRQYDGHNGHGGQPQDEERQHRRQSRSENPQDFLHQLRLGLIDTDEA